MAAGLSTRYGELKPLASVGPRGEALIDYTLFDAARSGYGDAVLVVRREIEDQVSRHVEELTSGSWRCRFVCQRVEDLPAGAVLPEDREQPWGTGHAVWTTRDLIQGPFAVVNADGFYGRAALGTLALEMAAQQTLVRETADPRSTGAWAITYQLADTLSTTGGVSRAILQVGDDGAVHEIHEVLRVHRSSQGIVGETPDRTVLSFSGSEPASMGLWGFTAGIFPLLEERFRALLSELTDERPIEFYLSDALNRLIASGDLQMKAVASGLPSFGVTFAEDRSEVRSRIERLVAEGHYPADLASAFPALANQNGSSATEP